MRVAVYLRISKDHAGEGLGVERQRQDCLEYIKSRPDWEITQIYTDNDVSAMKLTKPRPEFEKMLKAVEAGEIDVIVSKHLDRLLRRLNELERVFLLCEKAGTFLVTVSDGVDTSNDGGRLIARILASVAQGEVERKSSRQKRAMRQIAENGRGWGGRAFGYKEGDTGLIAKESNAIRRAYSEVLAGKTLHGIATDWNSRGLRTTKGEGNLWRTSTVKLVLINPRYAGFRAHKGEIVGKAMWPAVIDLETWEAVKTILTDPARMKKTPSSNTRKYLLTGMLDCGVCGKKLGVGGVAKCRCYTCKNIGCYKINRSVSSVDKMVSDVIKARLSMPDAAEMFIKPEADVRNLYDELRAKRKKMEQIALDYSEDVLTRNQFRVVSAKLEGRIEELEREIALSAQSNTFGDFDPAGDVSGWFDNLPLDRKRALISMLCNVTVNPVGRGWKKPAGFHGIDIRWRVDD